MCWHCDAISDLALSWVLFSAVMMASFSAKHRLHRLAIGEYSFALWRIRHSISCWIPDRLSSQACLESRVELALRSCFRVVLWFPYLSLNVVEVEPTYFIALPAPSGLTFAS